MSNQASRDKNILDEGICHHERVIVNDIHGKIVGVDFNAQMVQIEINVPAHMVMRAPEINMKEPASPHKG
jgi:hypothetical protein